MLRIFLLTTLLLVSLTLSGQNNPPGSETGFAVDYFSTLNDGIFPPSPNAASLGLFGNIPVGLYHGTAQYNIPIYTLKSAHLELPISLSYAGNGLRVDEISSNVGLGWALFTGGIITRTVYGRPDEAALRFNPQWLEDDPILTDVNNPQTIMFADYVLKTNDPIEYRGLDGQADIFHYNIQGNSGSFLFDGLNLKIIKGSNQVKISSTNAGNFTIIDTKGLKYYFTVKEVHEVQGSQSENKYRYLDNFSLEEYFPYSQPNSSFFTAWHLTKIEHPLGDSLIFKYKTVKEEYVHGYHEEIKAFLPGRTGNIIPTEGEEDGVQRLKRNQFIYGYTHSIKDVQHIESIKAGNGITIEFDYSIGREDMIANKGVKGGAILNSITVKQGETVIKKIKFTVEAKESTQNEEVFEYYKDERFFPDVSARRYRYFLTQLREESTDGAQEAVHRFEYYDLDDLPDRFLRAQDYGGFYNGSKKNRLVPCEWSISPVVGVNDTVIADGSNRTPDWQYAQKGMLKKITYPTGGTTSITYEANQRGNVDYPGVRVAKTIDIAGEGAAPVVKKYYYNDYSERNNSMAYIDLYSTYYEPGHFDEQISYYVRSCERDIVCPNCQELMSDKIPRYYTFFYNMYLSTPKRYFEETFKGLIFYSVVTESYGGENFEAGGKTTYFRYNSFVGPDRRHRERHANTKLGIYENWTMYYNGEKVRTVDFKVENESQIILREEYFHYSEEYSAWSNLNLVVFNQFPDNIVVCGGPFFGHLDMSNEAFVGRARENYLIASYEIKGSVLTLDSKETKTYDQNGANPVEQREDYSYNGYRQPASIIYTGSDGQTRKDTIIYAADLSAGVYGSMKSNNLLDYPVELVRYVNDKVVDAQLNIYAAPANIIAQYRRPLTLPQTGHNFYGGATIPSVYEKEWDYLYNNGNKLVEATYRSTKQTAYIWGYNNTYLTGIVENSAFSHTGIGNQPYSGALSGSDESRLRNLPNAMVTTFTYKPGVGMLTQTDPNGITTFYEYDAFGRLKMIKDHEGNILQYYEYQYAITD